MEKIFHQFQKHSNYSSIKKRVKETCIVTSHKTKVVFCSSSEQIQTVHKPAFSGLPGINKDFQITQDSSPWDIFELFFSPEMFKLIQKETSRYAKQQKETNQYAKQQKETKQYAKQQITKRSKRALCHPNLYLHCGMQSYCKK